MCTVILKRLNAKPLVLRAARTPSPCGADGDAPTVHVDSDTMTSAKSLSCKEGPVKLMEEYLQGRLSCRAQRQRTSRYGGFGEMPNFKCCLSMSTNSIFARTPGGKGTKISISFTVWLH